MPNLYLCEMKSFLLVAIAACILSGSRSVEDEVELVCVKTHKASNTCYYNFRIGGLNYSYLDNGCKGKKETILKKANQGKLALVKEWKIPCPEPKAKPAN